MNYYCLFKCYKHVNKLTFSICFSTQIFFSLGIMRKILLVFKGINGILKVAAYVDWWNKNANFPQYFNSSTNVRTELLLWTNGPHPVRHIPKLNGDILYVTHEINNIFGYLSILAKYHFHRWRIWGTMTVCSKYLHSVLRLLWLWNFKNQCHH